jgi:subtilisin family serine protease
MRAVVQQTKTLLKTLLLWAFLMLIMAHNAIGQQVAHGQWLVRLKPNTSVANLTALLENRPLDLRREDASSLSLPPAIAITPVSKNMNIWLLQQPEDEPGLLPWLLQQPEVLSAQPNHHLLERSNVLPNDPLFSSQWHLLNNGLGGGTANADIDADAAWNINTGGITPAGDTIVVAVIDGGVQRHHPDLIQNLWKNWAEIPNDGIDNDENGCIDDFLGWNVFAQNDNINGNNSQHGTPVCGVIGASGDNGIGIAGVNWNVKMMFVAGGNLESDLLAAYEYVLQARLRYNASNGTKGAFVVAVNCSWGIDYGMPADAPLWCAAFDELGEAGIVSVAATANNPVDVDIAGDLPTTCPSDYLISVTSLDKSDHLAPSAAWGQQHVDLGAYGESVFSTSPGNQYGLYTGTSFAAPQVTGAVGLLYAAPCPELIAAAKISPMAAALAAKAILLQNVTPNADLNYKTLSNGRLNLFQMVQNFQDQCASCPAPFALTATQTTPEEALLSWSTVANTQQVLLRWRMVGAADWTEVTNAVGAYPLDNLMPCTLYEFSLQNRCSNGENSDWSPSREFSTTGCCEATGFAWSLNVSNVGITLHLATTPIFQQYKVWIHEPGSPNWTSFPAADSVFIPDLIPCTAYELWIQGWCLDTWLNLTPLLPVKTFGCGSCTELEYCPAAADEAVGEWINTVQVGTWQHNSGWGGGGYQNLTEQQSSYPQLSPQSAVDVLLTPGFWGAAYKEYFRVFVDFNQDGDFDDVGELAFDPGFAQSGVVAGSLTSPLFTATGTTRMRVLMKYTEDNQTPPLSCGQFNFGQVEDYCVELIDTPTEARISFDSTLLLNIYPLPAKDAVWIDVSNVGNVPVELSIWNVSGNLVFQDRPTPKRKRAIQVNTSNWPSGIYFVAVSSKGKYYRGKMAIR